MSGAPPPAASTRKVTAPPRISTVRSSGIKPLRRARARSRRPVPGARGPPAVLVAGPEVTDVGHDLLREELGVLQRQLLRHAADLEQHHQVADPQGLDALGELLPDRGGAAGDDVALVQVLAPIERLADATCRGPDLRSRPALHRLHGAVARRLGEAFPDVQALLVEVVHVREILPLEPAFMTPSLRRRV